MGVGSTKDSVTITQNIPQHHSRFGSDPPATAVTYRLHIGKRLRDPYRAPPAVTMAVYTQSGPTAIMPLQDGASSRLHHSQQLLFPPVCPLPTTHLLPDLHHRPARPMRHTEPVSHAWRPLAAWHGCWGGLCRLSKPLVDQHRATVAANGREAYRPSRRSRLSSKAALCTPARPPNAGPASSEPMPAASGRIWQV